MNQTELVARSAALEPAPPDNMRGAAQLAWRAFLLNPRGYVTVLAADKPLRRGFVTLLWFLVAVAIAYLVGLALDLLTTPRIDLVQDQILDLIRNMAWFQQAAAATPNFTQQFEATYLLAWQAGRIIGGVPSWLGTGVAVVALFVTALLGWLAYGLTSFGLGRWLGAETRLSEHLGVLALSYAPKLLAVFSLLPGLSVPGALIFGWMLMTKYQALRVAQKLSWQRTLVVLFGAYLVLALIVFLVLILSLTSTLTQIPGLDFILNYLAGGGDAVGA